MSQESVCAIQILQDKCQRQVTDPGRHIAFLCYSLDKCPLKVHAKDFSTSQRRSWEVVEPLRGRAWWEKVRSWGHGLEGAIRTSPSPSSLF
jgi:hypothetical protein